MDRPEHGFDRSGSHSSGGYTCKCGGGAGQIEYCIEQDEKWMDWAESEISRLNAILDYSLEGEGNGSCFRP